MKIGFDAKRAFFNRSGLGNYSRNLLSSLFRFFPENDYYLYSPKSGNRIVFTDEREIRLRSPEKIIHKLLPSLWRSRGITKQITNDTLDIYHGLSSELPFSISKTGTATITTIHDLIYMRYPELYNTIDRNIYFRKTKYACSASDCIVAISNQTKDDIIDYTGTDPDKIKVIYQDCNPQFYIEPAEDRIEEIRTKYELPDTYLLYVGTIEARKNLLNLVKAIKTGKIDIPLVVIGRKTSYYNKVLSYIERNNISNVLFLDQVSNSDLPVIYRLSSCFIYPSVFEGFGIPVIEALVSGIPVITSKGSCFREAGGPGSIYVDPGNYEELSDAISRVINNRDITDKMIADGLEYSRIFGAKRIAGQYMDLYRSMI